MKICGRPQWSPKTWKNYKPHQMPKYPNVKHLNHVQHKIESYPPIVFAREIDQLKYKLKQCANKEAFIIQGGDCAESFEDYNFQSVLNLVKVLVHMGLIYSHESGVQVVKIGRIAGQYAKPRSNQYEPSGVLSFKGDIIHSLEDRTPDPNRMLIAYFHSISSLNVLRNINASGYLNLINMDSSSTCRR